MYSLLRSLLKKEWRFIVLLSAVLMITTTAPLVYGFLTTDANHHFTATHFSMPNDWFVYYAYITQGAQGHILFYDLFTAEPHQPTLNIFWLAVGLMAGLFNLSPEVALNVARLILMPIAVITVYVLSALFFEQKKMRALVTLIITTSSGLGMLLIGRIIHYSHNYFNGISWWPIDLWVPESGVFTMLYYSPHFVASFILILLYFIQLILYVRTEKWRHSLWAAVSAGIVLSFHPFHAPTIFGVAGIYFLTLCVFDRKWIKPGIIHGAMLVACCAPAIGYYAYLLNNDWVMAQKAVQNICTSPALWLTLVGYGGFWLFALYGSWRIVRESTPSASHLLLVVWAWVQLSLLYAPFNFQRRLNEGLLVPMVLLSALGISAYLYAHPEIISRVWKSQYRFFVLAILGLAMTITSLFHVAVDISIYMGQPEGLHRIPKGIQEASQWLANTPSQSIILNSASIGANPVPAYSGRRVYAGHGVETPQWRDKQKSIEEFFHRNHGEEEELLFLGNAGIDYIFYGPEEMMLGDYAPHEKSYLSEVYTHNGVRIYKVK